MFSYNPEVLPLFNHSNQANNTQQKALIAAIIGYATNIDNLNALDGTLRLITHKHVSLQIQPEHYPIVGENLLASISEVLGDKATSDVIEAWKKAYCFLADILVNREKKIYNRNANKPGGWIGFRNFNIALKTKENSLVTSFYLKPKDQGNIPTYSAGQYITVRVPTPDGSTTMRNYSLSDKSGQDYLRISVKKETGYPNRLKGYVSNKLHNDINLGDTLEIGPPCGNFFLNPNYKYEHPLILLAGGIGITPIISILLTAIDCMPNRKIILFYACVNEKVQTFRDTIDQLAVKCRNLTVHYCYKELVNNHCDYKSNFLTGDMGIEQIEPLIPSPNAEYYFCGSKPFMLNLYHGLLQWGIPESQLHFEFFGPKQALESPH